MHEVSIMQSALESAEQHAKAQGATRIHRIVLNIGAASGVAPDALEFAFGPVTEGTMADGATLEIIGVPVVRYCETCSVEFDAPDLLIECPKCGNYALEIRRGAELELASLEIS
jgi:hydrogenase nickel incorporation protein HypA/HybF